MVRTTLRQLKRAPLRYQLLPKQRPPRRPKTHMATPVLDVCLAPDDPNGVPVTAATINEYRSKHDFAFMLHDMLSSDNEACGSLRW